MASPALPGVFFCFAAMVLLIFVSVSSPTWQSVSFLHVGSGSSTVRYGVFGFTGHSPSVGYRFQDNPRLQSSIIRSLTRTLILHPLAAGITGFAFFAGLFGLAFHRVGTIIMALLSGLAFLIIFVAWIIDMILFGIARQRYRNQGDRAQYGNANWLTLGALVALVFGFCLSAFGALGSYKRRTRSTY